MARRKYIQFLLNLMLPVLFLIAACWQSQPQSSTESQGSSQAPECRLVIHDMGESCVPVQPERVIVIDTSALDAALFLGVKPIGSNVLKDFLSYSEEELADIELVGEGCQPNIEKILSLDPDLIISALYCDKDEIYERLSRIAPTVNVPSGDVGWKDDFRIYAQALGKDPEPYLDRYHARIEEFQQRMGERLSETEVSLVALADYGVGMPARVYLTGNFMGTVVAETGLKRPPGQQGSNGSRWVINLSLERLDIADADAIFLMEHDPELGLREQVTTHPLWSRLEAVQNGHVYPVNYGSWVAERSIGGANRILDDLFRYLLGDGDG